jgi:hypothetical protein
VHFDQFAGVSLCHCRVEEQKAITDAYAGGGCETYVVTKIWKGSATRLVTAIPKGLTTPLQEIPMELSMLAAMEPLESLAARVLIPLALG